MKKRQVVIASLLLLILLGLPTLAVAGGAGYAINWWTISSGGGTTSGSGYNVNGTAGQPAAGVVAGGSYTLKGGFWPGPFGPKKIYIPFIDR